MVALNSRQPKYGERGARMKDYRQRHQPPLALQRPVGDEEKCMALCPSQGQTKLGDKAQPLPPEWKDNYERRKAREKDAKAQAIRFQKGQVRGPRKKGVKRKPSPTRSGTPPPAPPGPIMTVFPVTPPLPVLQHPTAQSARPADDGRGPSDSPSLPWATFSCSMPLTPVDSPSPTVPLSTFPGPIHQLSPAAMGTADQSAQNVGYSDVHIISKGAYATDSPATTSYLQTDRRSPSADRSPPSPGTWAESPGLSTTPLSLYITFQLNPRLTAARQGGGQSEDDFNTVYESFFVRRPLGGEQSATPALGPEHTKAPSNTIHTSWYTPANTSHLLRQPLPSPPSVTSSPGASTGTSFSTGANAWSSTDQRGEPVATASGISSRYQWRDPVKTGASSATNAPGVGRHGSATHATFRAEFSSTGHSNAWSAGYTFPIHPATAKLSAAPVYVDAAVTEPIVAPVSQQILQPDVSANQAITPLKTEYGAWTGSSPSYDINHLRATPAKCATTSLRLATPTNQPPSGMLTTVNVQQHVQSARTATSIRAYSKLAGALVGYHAEAPSAEGAVDAPLSSPKIWDSAIGNPSMNARGHIASQASSTSDEMACIFEGCFDDCEPFPLHIVSLLLGADFAGGQSTDPSQQLPTTSTWQEARI